MELDRRLEVSYDQYIRTSVEPGHRAGVEKLWRAVAAAGDIYKRDYSGLYCSNCERFYDSDELLDGLCPEHFVKPETVQETNYFFSLSRYQTRLEELISSDSYRVIPGFRKNEVLSFIRSGLRDFSISRSMERARGWGIPVPGDESQVMYVWFDALANYITALDYADEGELYRRYWLDNPRRVHGIGKGIIRFHAVLWPAMLLSAGVPLPHTLFVHGYYTVEGRKMGKSLGNTVDPVALVNRYGSEAVRHYFLATTPSTADSDFSIEAFEARYNADLANDLGNLLNRTVSMIRRYRDGVVPLVSPEQMDRELIDAALGLGERVARGMDGFDFQTAMAPIWVVITSANRYIERKAPWKMAKDEENSNEAGPAPSDLDAVLHTLVETLRLVSIHLQPFLPETSMRMREQLGLRDGARNEEWDWPHEVTVGEPQPLFPRLDRQ